MRATRPAAGWVRRLSRGMREVAGLLLPGRCLGCASPLPLDAPDRLVCPACRGRLLDPPWPRCPRCHMPLGTGRAPEPDCLACRGWPRALLRARWAVPLEPPADALVHGLKYEGWRALAPFMAERMARLEPGLPAGAPPPVVVPVPTTRRRERSRGYNQARLLATELSRIRGLERVDALERRDGGRTQVSLHPDERRANVEDAFRLTAGARLNGLTVLLVDDVLTTGATASAAATTLERGGASGVLVVTFARSLPGLGASARTPDA